MWRACEGGTILLQTQKMKNSAWYVERNCSDAVKPTGVHSVEFDAKGFSSGLYFYRMTAAGNVDMMKKMVH